VSTGAAGQVVLVRHAETEWTLNGRHTGRTDLPLTENGRQAAVSLAPFLASRTFQTVLVSPLIRARETCELSGMAGNEQLREDLLEWDYGDYEGLTSTEIDAQRPGWSLWRDGCPGGEDARAVGARADRVIAEASDAGGDVALFSHGHMLRVLGARWISLEATGGSRLGLAPGALCLLSHEHGAAILASWNEPALRAASG
jgi:broad specificity phosphatase PhoE